MEQLQTKYIIEKETKMTNDLIQNILYEQEQLEHAIETRELFLQLGDWNMVAAWDEQLDFICARIKGNGYVNLH